MMGGDREVMMVMNNDGEVNGDDRAANTKQWVGMNRKMNNKLHKNTQFRPRNYYE